MIKNAKRSLKAMSDFDGIRVVNGHTVQGSATSVTLSRHPILEVSNDEVPEEKPSYEQVVNALSGKVLASDLTQDELDCIMSIYDDFDPDGKEYEQDDLFKYQGQLYKVNQAHTSQSDWLPGVAEALYSSVAPAGVIAEWAQPVGQHDAYNIGDTVSFNGRIYESKINANVWSPTVYPAGWEDMGMIQ